MVHKTVQAKDVIQHFIRSILQIASSPASAHYPSQGHTDGPWRVSPVKREMQQSMHQRGIVFFQQSIYPTIRMVSAERLNGICD